MECKRVSTITVFPDALDDGDVHIRSHIVSVYGMDNDNVVLASFELSNDQARKLMRDLSDSLLKIRP